MCCLANRIIDLAKEKATIIIVKAFSELPRPVEKVLAAIPLGRNS